MGCGSSSLKGDAPDGLTGPSQPVSATSPSHPGTKGTFASVDFDRPSERKKSRWNAAPHETEMPEGARGGSVDGPGGIALTKAGLEGGDGKDGGVEMGNLQPYNTLDEEHMAAELSSPNRSAAPEAASYPHERPKSSGAQVNGNSGGQDLKFISNPEELEQERREAENAGKKGSLLGRIGGIKGGRKSQEVGDEQGAGGGVGGLNEVR